MDLLWGSLLFLVIGGAAWLGGYLKFTKPQHSPYRGVVCIPGIVMVLISLVLFGFFWHWILGTLAIFGLGYAGFKMIFRGT